uniref:Hexosyltransferase n=1 Tax=Gouania willdenowi TaxID=441366 RepID=A0A8C5FY74_GOUWI
TLSQKLHHVLLLRGPDRVLGSPPWASTQPRAAAAFRCVHSSERPSFQTRGVLAHAQPAGVCQRARPYLITMVTSPLQSEGHASHQGQLGWGRWTVRGLRVMTLFMVGVVSDPCLSKLLVEGAKEKGDLIQGRFMTIHQPDPEDPVLAGLVDDDVLFNPGALLHFLNRSRNPYEQVDLYLGRVHLHVAPDRDPDSKHYLPSGAYPLSVFPDYCSGTAYVLSRSALLKISLAASASPLSTPLPPEDVFVGLCARTAGVLPSHCPLFSGGPGVPYGRCCYQAMVSIHHIPPREMLHYWHLVIVYRADLICFLIQIRIINNFLVVFGYFSLFIYYFVIIAFKNGN